MPNEFCYTAAITGCGIGGQWEQAVETFRYIYIDVLYRVQIYIVDVYVPYAYYWCPQI